MEAREKESFPPPAASLNILFLHKASAVQINVLLKPTTNGFVTAAPF